MRLTRQRFHISREIIFCATQEEINASYFDMEEMGIAHLPYHDLDIVVPASIIFQFQLDDHKQRLDPVLVSFLSNQITFRYTNSIAEDWYMTDSAKGAKMVSLSDFHRRHPDSKQLSVHNRDMLLDVYRRILIVMLATRNIIKEVRPHKAAQLGIGKCCYAYTTTLRIGTITEALYEGEPTRATPRPHLRRGHIRRQHHGPLNELVKKIWIAPTMVNVDQEFVDRRTAYNISP